MIRGFPRAALLSRLACRLVGPIFVSRFERTIAAAFLKRAVAVAGDINVLELVDFRPY